MVDNVVDVDGVRDVLHDAHKIADNVLDKADDVIDVADAVLDKVGDVVDKVDDVLEDVVDDVIDEIPTNKIVAFIKKLLKPFGICGTN